MKRKLAWVCLLVSPLVVGGVVAAIFLIGYSKKEPEWPIDVHSWTLYSDYIQDGAKADLKYKGKYLLLENGAGQPNEVEKYVPYFDQNGREIVRCYYEGQVQYYGGERYSADGVCQGMRDGMVILKKGKAYCSGGPDWN